MHGAKVRTEQLLSQSIIAWLYALAVLCERAAFASAPVRLAVLWGLRRGAHFMREYAQGLAEDCGYGLEFAPEQAWHDCSPQDAFDLAYQFRALAGVLQALFSWLDALAASSEGRVIRLVALKKTQATLARIASQLQASGCIGPSARKAPDTS